MARTHRLAFVFSILLCSQIFAFKAVADERSLPQIGSVEINSANVEKVTNNSDSSVIDSNVIASIGRINNKLKGDSVSAQASLLNMQFNADFSTTNDNINYDNNDDNNGEDISPIFALASMYYFSDSTQMGLHYNNGPVNEVNSNLLNIIEPETGRTEIVELAVQHKFNNNLALIANANWKNWSSVNDDDDGSYNKNDADNYDDTFGAGTSLSYQVNSWTLQTGVSIDTNPVSSNNSSSLLGLDEQWRLGFGGIKKLNANMSIGMSYQYQSIGTTKVGREDMQTSATYSDDNIHFITTTLSF